MKEQEIRSRDVIVNEIPKLNMLFIISTKGKDSPIEVQHHIAQQIHSMFSYTNKKVMVSFTDKAESPSLWQRIKNFITKTFND